jgi:hypothetical protein
MNDAASDSAPAHAHDDGEKTETCTSPCSRLSWPRLIVGLIPSEGMPAVPKDVDVSIVKDGMKQDAPPGFCPRHITGVVCSHAVHAGNMTESIELVVSSSGREQRKIVSLSAFNSCGRDIAYLPVLFTAHGDFEFARERYLSACD